jgi:hypothetical protein
MATAEGWLSRGIPTGEATDLPGGRGGRMTSATSVLGAAPRGPGDKQWPPGQQGNPHPGFKGGGCDDPKEREARRARNVHRNSQHCSSADDTRRTARNRHPGQRPSDGRQTTLHTVSPGLSPLGIQGRTGSKTRARLWHGTREPLTPAWARGGGEQGGARLGLVSVTAQAAASRVTSMPGASSWRTRCRERASVSVRRSKNETSASGGSAPLRARANVYSTSTGMT